MTLCRSLCLCVCVCHRTLIVLNCIIATIDNDSQQIILNFGWILFAVESFMRSIRVIWIRNSSRDPEEWMFLLRLNELESGFYSENKFCEIIPQLKAICLQ